jgi:uncharacterized protein (TIGR02118 family)
MRDRRRWDGTGARLHGTKYSQGSIRDGALRARAVPPGRLRDGDNAIVRSLMVKLVFVNYRRPDLTAEEFQRHWITVHAPLVLSVKDAIGIRRYVQNRPLSPGALEAFAAARGMVVDDLPDGITEAWWDSPEDMDNAFASEEGKKAAQLLLEDESKFLDHARSRAILSKQHTIIGGDPALWDL